MNKLFLILCVVFVSSALADSTYNETYTYRISPECIVNGTITEKSDLLPTEAVAYQINIQLTGDAGVKLEAYTREIIGMKLELTNGLGESLNIPSYTVVKEFGLSFRLSPFASKGAAKHAMELAMKEGGECGPVQDPDKNSKATLKSVRLK